METLTTLTREALSRLLRIEEIVALIKEELAVLREQRNAKEWYSTAEVAVLLGKAEFTVREWCRQHRIHSSKQRTGRGAFLSYAISHEELLRIQKEGLLPANHQMRN